MGDRVFIQHDEPTRFTTFALGQPGEREFFIYIESTGLSTTIACEKMQVIALATRFSELISTLRKNKMIEASELFKPATIDSAEITFPVEEDFMAGVIAIAWEELLGKVQVEIQGIGDGTITELIGEFALTDIEQPPELMRAFLTIPMIRGFINTSNQLANSGRKPCIFCGLPINPDGHLCPRANGYKR